MKSIASVLSIIALGFELVACTGGGGGGGGGSTSAFIVSTTAADFGVVGNAYTSTLTVTGGTAPFTWILFGGTLPTGLSLDAGTGVVSGTPTVDGNSTAVFTVTDSTGKTATGSVLFAVHPRTDLLSVDNSTSPVPGIAPSSRPSISNDGRFVAFASSASNLIPVVGGSQIYLHDWQTNQTSLVSRDSGVAINPGNGTSSAPSISSDGRFVTFVSNSTNLVTGVSGQQIYLRDVQTGVTSLVSKDNLGNQASGGSATASPSISSAGRFVAYVSDATNLVTGTTGQQVYLYDSQTTIAFPNGQTTLISKDNHLTPLPGDGASSSPSISRDGCFVAFASLSTNLIFPPPGNQQIYVRGTQLGPGICAGTFLTILVSKDNSASPVPGNGLSSSPSISLSGRFVAFTSLASNLVPPASGQQIYMHDRFGSFNGTTSLVSKDNSASPVQGNGNSSISSISDDGCSVAFASVSTNFGVLGGNRQIYVRGPLPGPGICPGTEQTSLVSQDNSPVPVAGDGLSSDPSVNANGGFVAFSSLSTNLVLPAPGNQQIYVRSLP